MRIVEEHNESEPAVVRLTPKASRSRSSTRPYPQTDASQAKDAQPGDASATAANPEPATSEVSEALAELSDGTRLLCRYAERQKVYQLVLACITSNKFRGKTNTPVGYERLTTVSFRSSIGKALQLFPG